MGKWGRELDPSANAYNEIRLTDFSVNIYMEGSEVNSGEKAATYHPLPFTTLLGLKKNILCLGVS